MVYYFHEEFRSFLEGQPIDDMNKLSQAVLADLNTPFNLAGCKALGLISKLLLGPLWRVIEDNTVEMYEMGAFMKEVVENLDKIGQDVGPFLKGGLKLSSNSKWAIKKDKVFYFLVAENDQVDSDVETCLSIMLPAISKLLKEHFQELIANVSPSTEFKSDTASVVKHNIFSERVFAYTDHLLKVKPNISHIASEAYIKFCLNKTDEWLCAKNQDEKDIIIGRARADVQRLHSEYMKRKDKIRTQREDNLKAKREKEKQRRLQKTYNRTHYFRQIQYFGLWQSREEVDIKLGEIATKTEKLEALRAQMRFRKFILRQPADPLLFNFSKTVTDGPTGKKRPIQFGVQKLKDNCLELIRLAETVVSAPQHDNIDEIINRGAHLLGKRIIHTMLKKKDENDHDEVGVPFNYQATVISMVPGYPEWFNLKYDTDQDLYVLKLHDEMKSGDVRLL